MARLRFPSPLGAFLVDLCGLRSSSDVARAQLEALARRVPYLYGILVVNVLAISITHHRGYPAWQVVVLPAIITVIMGKRMIWWSRIDVAALPEPEVRRILAFTTSMGVAIGVATLAWAISLHEGELGMAASGHLTANGHVDFFVGITVVSCIFLLMHLRLAAILLSVVIVGPFALYLLVTGRAIEAAIALNLLLVTAAMLYVAVNFARDFERMVTTAADLQRLSTQNARLAAADALTDLPNRRRFFRELDQAGQGAAAFAVIVVDLDGFKQVNDVYGHNAGDDVLRAIAIRLAALVPAETCLARLGGDEFACLLLGPHAAAAASLAHAMIAGCATPIVCPSFTANIGASAGICLSDACPDNPAEIYEHADYALFEAKRAGRGRVESFSFQHDHSIRRSSTIAHLLRAADLCDQLSAVYQPILAAGSHRITSFETLVRWTSPELGPVGPDEFIPIAERTDLIFEISRHVLRSAMQQTALWPDHVSVKVNLSVRDLMSPEQTALILAELRQSPVSPTRITFELTETIFAESLDVVRANVAILRSTGCKIAIDDFGVGHSNLNYIHALAPDIIKIDRCFTDSVATDEASRRIIRTIIDLARNLGATSIAEGVETQIQARLLAEYGCDELQGYYFSQPVTAPVAAAMARWGLQNAAAA